MYRAADGHVLGGAAEYLVGAEADVQPELGPTPLPEPLAGSGYLTRGNNVSDDLFLYVKRRVPGFEPGRMYRVRFCVSAATKAREGDPGQRYLLKVGASAAEPGRIVEGEIGSPSAWWAYSVEKVGGIDPQWGYLERPSSEPFMVYGAVTRTSDMPIEVQADSDGAIWMWAGVDSVFEVTAEVYWIEFGIAVTEVP